VHLSLPQDALERPADLAAVPLGQAFAPPVQALDATVARELLGRLLRASRPLVLCGPAALRGEPASRMHALEAASGIPVVGMESPRGTADPSLGAVAPLLAEADLVLLLGKRLDFTLKAGAAFSAACEFLQVDAESDELDRTRRAVGARVRASVVADVAPALLALERAAREGSPAAPSWRDEVRAAIAYRPAAWDTARAAGPDRLHPVQALRPLQALLDSHADSVLVSDGGEIGQWAQACLHAPNRVINGVAGSIGASLPFALAARLARPESPVVVVLGDGTFGFHPAEIDTAVRYGLPFLAVVGNDARWNAEYQIQLRDYGRERLVGCELLPTRYDQVAEGFGAYGELVSEADAMRAAIRRAIESKRPAVLNVLIEGQPAPHIARP
jgi:acetolactate synthase-1/2/3 large subunit